MVLWMGGGGGRELLSIHNRVVYIHVPAFEHVFRNFGISMEFLLYQTEAPEIIKLGVIRIKCAKQHPL